jgi:hypothetical protein
VKLKLKAFEAAIIAATITTKITINLTTFFSLSSCPLFVPILLKTHFLVPPKKTAAEPRAAVSTASESFSQPMLQFS